MTVSLNLRVLDHLALPKSVFVCNRKKMPLAFRSKENNKLLPSKYTMTKCYNLRQWIYQSKSFNSFDEWFEK